MERETVGTPRRLPWGSTRAPFDPRSYPMTPAYEWDKVFSFILNKMVGSGIFNTPLTTYLILESRRATIAVWVGAFVHTVLSMLIYMDYCSVFPYTGGELVYLTEMTTFDVSSTSNSSITEPTTETTLPRNHQKYPRLIKFLRRFLGDGLLAYVTYSILFILLFSSASNTMQFGRLFILLIQARDTSISDHSLEATLIGVIAFTLICLMHLWSPEAGRKMNIITAYGKVLMLISLLVVGAVAAGKRGSDNQEIDAKCLGEVARTERHGDWGWVRALLIALFSFQGWENATFVAGELGPKCGNQSAFRYGFMASVILVGMLYLSIIIVFVYSFPLQQLQMLSDATRINYAPAFNGCSDAGIRAWAAVAAVSCFGSINSIIYTSSRVRRSIGYGNVLPWSRLWRSERISSPVKQVYDPLADACSATEGNIGQENNQPDICKIIPSGGLLLHWLMTIVMVLIVSVIISPIERVGVPGLLQTYAHMVILAVLGFIWWRLSSRDRALNSSDNGGRFWRFNSYTLQGSWKTLAAYIGLTTVLLHSGFSIAVFFLMLKTGRESNNELPGSDIAVTQAAESRSRSLEPWHFITIIAAMISIAFVYHLVVFGNVKIKVYDIGNTRLANIPHGNPWVARYYMGRVIPSLPPLPEETRTTDEDGILFNSPALTWLNALHYAKVKVTVKKEDKLGPLENQLERIQQYGQRWTVSFSFVEGETLKYLEERYLNVGERFRHENVTEPLGPRGGLFSSSPDFNPDLRDPLGLRHRHSSLGMLTPLSAHGRQRSDYSTNGHLPTADIFDREENGLTNSPTQDVEATTPGLSASRRTWFTDNFNRYMLYRLFGGIC